MGMNQKGGDNRESEISLAQNDICEQWKLLIYPCEP